MGNAHFDVVIIGGGCAGISAAIGLAKAGFGVAVLEAAAFPGAENWSGCVYFCENLVHPLLLGPDGMEGLAWERRLVERGFFQCDGHSLLGMTYRDSDAFRHCYTVLRPIFDHHLAQLAQQLGVLILNNTTAESLIRDSGRVVGVATNRGPIYGDLTFLAEGDASHLVTREGYEKSRDPHYCPKFLHGIKQIIDLPPGAVERNFGLDAAGGAAYELVLRNGSLHGKPVHLNMGGFIYTNRQSLSIGLVLPADHLGKHFAGDPNLLIEWFEHLPVLRRWLRDGRRGVFGAKLIRGGGARDIPQLVDNGLAIGGAATAVGVDFPYPNFTGPATRMGLQLVTAVQAIRARRRDFTREELQHHYVEPIRETRYWKDVEFLRRWPGYVEKTKFFFGQNIDLSLETAHTWTQPQRWFVGKWRDWVRSLVSMLRTNWRNALADMDELGRAVHFTEVAGRPALGRLLLDGWVNALRDLCRKPRSGLPPAGRIQLVYRVGDDTSSVAPPPQPLRNWFRRFQPVLAAAARQVYANDDTPLRDKLRGATQLLVRQVNILDLLWFGAIGLAAGLSAFFMVGWTELKKWFFERSASRVECPTPSAYQATAAKAGDLTPLLSTAAQKWDDRLGRLAYQTEHQSHIHVLWPQDFLKKKEIVNDPLWHVCPAHVYEARADAQGHLQVVVNFENCIKCETCWRTSPTVDWGRDGSHRFIYAAPSPALDAVAAAAREYNERSLPRPRARDWWTPLVESLHKVLRVEQTANGHGAADWTRIRITVGQLDQKLTEFGVALGAEPRTLDRDRREFLLLLARYAQQLAEQLTREMRECLEEYPDASPESCRAVVELGNALAGQIASMIRHADVQRYSWAAADGRHAQQHHLEGIKRLVQATAPRVSGVPPADPVHRWIRAEHTSPQESTALTLVRNEIGQIITPTTWRDLEQGKDLSPGRTGALRELIGLIPPIVWNRIGTTLHAPLRKAILAELGRRDPSVAYRVATHLWARDFSSFLGLKPPEGWSAFAWMPDGRVEDGHACGEALLVPAAQYAFCIAADHGFWVDLKTMPPTHLKTLGLRGAQPQRLSFQRLALPADAVAVDREEMDRLWRVLSSTDLTSIAFGMADRLTDRSVDYALTRVQFPGLFHDEQARDGIAKFGAVKKLIAEMEARRSLIEMLDKGLLHHDVTPQGARHADLVKAIVAEALGAEIGSVAYNAGQIFGGMGFSEEDLLAKYYRDAAAWRFLGNPNADIWRTHGEELLQGAQLSTLEHEAELFDQVAHRQALQLEMDELRVLRTQLRHTLHELQNGTSRSVLLVEALARQDAHLFVSKALLLRTHARLESGLGGAEALASLRVWLKHTRHSFAAFRDEVERASRSSALARSDSANSIHTLEEYLQQVTPYQSGDYLTKPIDFTLPRYFPELVQVDSDLSKVRQRYRSLIQQHFGPRGPDHLPYERYIETRHRPDAEDLEFCRTHGLLRLLIPRDLGGEGKRKAEYYLLTTELQHHADVSMALAVQVHTSLSTTPVSIARDKELPKARRELTPFLSDDGLSDDILRKLKELAASGEPSGQALRELTDQLQRSVFAHAAVRTAAHPFVQAWDRVTRSVKDSTHERLHGAMKEAAAAWKEVRLRASELYDELVHREKACEQFLRWIAAGQIAGFALTEPSAGSDTARIASRAVLRSVPVEREPDGALRFVPHGIKETRYLIDANALEFHGAEVRYRWSPTEPASVIRFDLYDYETDNPLSSRYYDHGSRRVYFSDIAQVRQRGGRLWYDYWEIDGSKMWITNGRIMGLMCLYTKTAEGLTGFLVDRHAEGLFVGKDEAKMGQCGSPTNELSLRAVRVPRENVLGLEGRGQVNALETLNVGRAGIGMASLAQLSGVVDLCREFQNRPEATAGNAERFQRLLETQFIAEAVAFETVGRLDHKQTKSIRLESAIAKMLISELLHESTCVAEEMHGLPGQTQEYLLEKRKRDARVMTIYEGTSEIQRFFILRDLIGDVLPRWPDAPVPAGADGLARTVNTLRSELQRRLRAAHNLLGAELGSNPNLQANCFLLSEIAAWLKACDSVAARLHWLTGQPDVGTPQQIAIGENALARCVSESRRRLAWFDEEMTVLQRRQYAVEVRAANHILEAHQRAKEQPIQQIEQITKPLSLLVVMQATTVSPQPYLQQGKLIEPRPSWCAHDAAALEIALRVQAVAPELVSVRVATIGSRALLPLLRESLAVGAASALLVLAPEDTSVEAGAEALALTLRRRGERFDLVLSGANTADQAEGLLAAMTMPLLDLPAPVTSHAIAVSWTKQEQTLRLLDEDGKPRTRALPASVLIQNELPLRRYSIADYLRTLDQPVLLEQWPRSIPLDEVNWTTAARMAQPAPATKPAHFGPVEAAVQVMDELDLGGAAAPSAPAVSLPFEVTPSPTFLEGRRVIAVLSADRHGRLSTSAAELIQSAHEIAAHLKETLAVLLLASDPELARRSAIGVLGELGAAAIVVLSNSHLADVAEIRARCLQESWPALPSPPKVVVGESWTDDAFLRIRQRSERPGRIALRVERTEVHSGQILVHARSGRNLRITRRMDLHAPGIHWISLADGDRSERSRPTPTAVQPRVQLWTPPLQRWFATADMQQLLDELRGEMGVVHLGDAEFIIDVGFGVGSRDGYEKVIQPLERSLNELGVTGLIIGGTRKITEELHLLPGDRQIGQSGHGVNPRILLAIGVSGAPQHLNYIGTRATIVAFNRDPEAPIMTLNQRQAQPRVFAVVGDLFETVAAFTAALQREVRRPAVEEPVATEAVALAGQPN